jgi:hypothetical protein
VRAEAFGAVKTDYVRDNQGRLRKLSVEKGLLREVECVQAQIKAALKCTVGMQRSMFPFAPADKIRKFLDDEVDNEITLLAFRLLVSDLLELFHVVNEGVINVLGMSPLLTHYVIEFPPQTQQNEPANMPCNRTLL